MYGWLAFRLSDTPPTINFVYCIIKLHWLCMKITVVKLTLTFEDNTWYLYQSLMHHYLQLQTDKVYYSGDQTTCTSALTSITISLHLNYQCSKLCTLNKNRQQFIYSQIGRLLLNIPRYCVLLIIHGEKHSLFTSLPSFSKNCLQLPDFTSFHSIHLQKFAK